MSKNRNITTMCNVCGKVMRDDHLKRHIDAKHSNVGSDLHHTEIQQQNNNPMITDQHDYRVKEASAKREELDNLPDGNGVNIKLELHRDNEVYQKNVKIGKQISTLLKSDNIPEKSLSRQNKFCLDLFRAQQPTTDVDKAELRLWQMQLLDVVSVDEMNDRKIIWVVGKEGNEGKSWFQSYLQSLHGEHRVARFDITNKTADLLHIMSRCALATTDMFLFNHQRCVSSEDCCYSLLEMIKDGYASAPKFHGSLLRIKRPNLVLVFSNRHPRIRSLSKDRWQIFFITDDGLTAGHEEWMWEKQGDDHTMTALKNNKTFRK